MAQEQLPDTETAKKAPTSAQVHTRETLLYIVLPIVGGILFIIAVLIAMLLLLPNREQIGTVADLLLSIFVLCPLALCLLPIYVLLVVAAFMMNRVHDSAAKPLTRLENLARSMAESIRRSGYSLNRRSIPWATKFIILDKFLGVHEESDESVEQK